MAQASAEKLKHSGPAEKERVASVPESSRQVRQNRLCQKEKERSRLSRVPDRNVGESRTLTRERGIREGAWRRKGGLHSEEGKQEEPP